MNNLSSIIDKYDLKVSKYSYKNKAIILDTEKGNFVLKKRKRNDKKELYDYLLSRNFSFFLYPENNFNDDYEIYAYVDEISTIKEEKAIHLIYILAELENRTTSYKEYTLDEIKEIYEEKGKQIDMLFEYYNNLEEVFSSSVYPSPYELLLLNNVSKIYNTLNYSKELLEEWYKHISNTRKRRIVLSHNHLSLDHFLDCKDAKVINFDYASYKSPIYDFAYLYKNHYHELDMLSLFTTYQRKYLYTDDELLLFFIEIIIPPKINLKKNTYENTLLIHKLITYIDSTRDFILKKQKKQQEEH